MILIFSNFLMDFYKNNQNAAILKRIKILKNCHGRFTANYLKFLWSHSIHGKIWYNFTPTFLKIWKIWALCSPFYPWEIWNASYLIKWFKDFFCFATMNSFVNLNLPIFPVSIRRRQNHKNILVFWVLTRIWIGQIREVLLVLWILGRVNVFMTHTVGLAILLPLRLGRGFLRCKLFQWIKSTYVNNRNRLSSAEC